jgi:hypothetical protein
LEQQWAILQLTRIASNLLAVVQALLFSGNETSELPSLIHELSIIGTCNTSVPATMVTDNRFSILADSKVFDDCEEPSTSREAVSKVDVEEYSKIECQQADDHPQSGQNSQDGWGDDITIDEDGEAVYMDPREGDRRRKVSQGPRPGGNKGVSLGFPYEFTNSSQLRMGRGGGLGQPTAITLGLLPPITEDLVEPEEDPTKDKISSTVPPAVTPQQKSETMFMFRAQLTWGLEQGPNVNLPTLFRDWVANSVKLIPDFGLLPFEDEKGQMIDSVKQVPDDNPDFYQEYY